MGREWHADSGGDGLNIHPSCKRCRAHADRCRHGDRVWGYGISDKRGDGASDIGASAAPVNSQLPVITGTAQVGKVLTSSTGTWTGATSFAYQWAGNQALISGATASTYTPVSSNAGATLTATVTATGPGGTASATSAPTVPIVAGAVAVVVV